MRRCSLVFLLGLAACSEYGLKVPLDTAEIPTEDTASPTPPDDGFGDPDDPGAPPGTPDSPGSPTDTAASQDTSTPDPQDTDPQDTDVEPPGDSATPQDTDVPPPNQSIPCTLSPGVPVQSDGLYDVSFEISADDFWYGWLDGTAFDEQGAFNITHTYDWTLPSGTHTLAVHAEDRAETIAGFISSLRVEGVPTCLTGMGVWVQSETQPPADWVEPGFADGGWEIEKTCSNVNPWQGQPAPLLSQGAEWVWYDSDCQALGEAWFRLRFTLP